MTDSDSLREIQFSVPPGSSYEDQYTIHWDGSCVLQHLYSPGGIDILQLEKQHVYNYFSWGFVYFTFNPRGLAYRYGFDEEGLWRIQMKIVDPTVPSLYGPDGFRVSIHRRESKGETKYLGVGQSYVIDLPSVPSWYTGEVEYNINANSSQVDVSGALLEYSYHDVYDTNVYDYSYWKPYNQTVVVTNVWTEPLSLEMYSSRYILRYIDYETNDEGLEFTLDSMVFDSTYDYQYFGLYINAAVPLDSSTLYVPTGSKAEDPYRILGYYDDEYYTLDPIYGVYRVSFNPYHAWKVLEDDVYGVWSLMLPRAPQEHDLSVELEAPAFLDPGESSLLNVTVGNLGLNIETNVELQLLINGTMVNSTLIEELPVGSFSTISYLWAPELEGAYNATAYAPPVPGENVIANNVVSKMVYTRVSLIGDINRDGIVDIFDVVILANAFGSKPGDTNWNPDADLNSDDVVDIFDVVTIANNFGATV